MSSHTNSAKTLRLILGDQLHINHSWFKVVDSTVVYVLMEVRSETDYVWHHIQKVAAFFSAMRHFAAALEEKGHWVIYIKLNDRDNVQTFAGNCNSLISKYHFNHFEYLLPDEYRVDQELLKYSQSLTISSASFDTEHFFTSRKELGDFFEGKKTYLMESFYRYMRKKHSFLMQGTGPYNGQWNFDAENRKKLPVNHRATEPFVFKNSVAEIISELAQANIQTIGTVDSENFIWPVSRQQSLELLDFFATECLPLFGTYQDAMSPQEWSLYHSRLSFSLNCKLISPQEVIDRALLEWEKRPDEIAFNQLEGFVRQVLGWREYMRGMYWLKMPEFASVNYFANKNKLPDWYWTGKTKMNCLREAISQSLNYAYAHHIQRLMVTGNFALLAGVDPDEVDKWYLGIYIDALQWVEITNTRGMSQYADGGLIATKPYVSSATYIDKMSHYCSGCYYNKTKKTGDRACPFNSLYWNFYDQHREKLSKNARVGMMYNVWQKMKPADKSAILQQAEYYLTHINEL
ncbi:cryptochrome/photolyase family protein [Sphingobacteriaceae bacterium]|nr:cryptochrome/photolyase family protein [Sphingobacteriaceae bacterium]